jgi:acetylornithine deacetylase/succinyl-diaminopimelate desuccinylase-like protein
MLNLDAAEKLFTDFLQIPSISATPGEVEASQWVAAQLKALGLEPQLYSREDGAFPGLERTNVLAKISAPGLEPSKPPLVLLSHIDVVSPGDETAWTHPPFSAQLDDGRIWARGTLDTKHLTIMELYALAALLENPEKLRRDVWFVAAIDEEQGSHYGVEYLAEVLGDKPGGPFSPGALVLSEGGGFPVSVGGRQYITVTAGEKSVDTPGPDGETLTQRRIQKALGGIVPAEDDGASWKIYNYAGEHSPEFVTPEAELEAFMALALDCCHAEGFDGGIMPMLAFGRTDGRFFGPKGCSVYGFSPVLMEDSFDRTLTVVHKPNESIGLESFRFGCRVLRALCVELTKGV